jgi:tRNA(Arg) A34 adenosine deaminase TadA
MPDVLRPEEVFILEEFVKTNNGPPVVDPKAPLAEYWNKKVSELATAQPTSIRDEDAERHYIFSLLVAALVHRFWNGNKNGQTGEYPWRQGQKLSSGIYDGGQYLGHNIACIGVDGLGEVIDFDFNHNEIFSSSVEHAESRLVRRVFSLAQVYDDWHMRRSDAQQKPDDYMNILSNVTVYTSLESCAQCSGIMALGKLKAVAYLQQDPGQFAIGNILRNLTTQSLRAPLPISADLYRFPYYDVLNRGFRSFYQDVLKRPFYTDSTGQIQDNSQSITSFLCTDEAKTIFDEAFKEFQAYKVKFSSYKPLDNGKPNPRMLTNEQVLNHVREFFKYASACGHRGTAHKL